LKFDSKFGGTNTVRSSKAVPGSEVTDAQHDDLRTPITSVPLLTAVSTGRDLILGLALGWSVWPDRRALGSNVGLDRC
jgi:hypothetical protein